MPHWLTNNWSILPLALLLFLFFLSRHWKNRVADSSVLLGFDYVAYQCRTLWYLSPWSKTMARNSFGTFYHSALWNFKTRFYLNARLPYQTNTPRYAWLMDGNNFLGWVFTSYFLLFWLPKSLILEQLSSYLCLDMAFYLSSVSIKNLDYTSYFNWFSQPFDV